MTNTVQSAYTTPAYAVKSHDAKFEKWACPRRAPTEDDVRIQIEYCGICHSDVHQARDEWTGSIYPMVPGHEIVGKVIQLGEQARKQGKFKEGDIVGVGCFVDSCRQCDDCKNGLAVQFCPQLVLTYNGRDKSGEPTYGGYAREIVVDYRYVLRIPQKLATPELLPRAAPLLCAGITTYSPLHYAGVKKGNKVGINGLGGLGHVAVRLAKAMGCTVVVLSRSEKKRQDAIELLKADQYLMTSDPEAMKREAGTFDLILDTVSAPHDLTVLTALLRRDGKLCLLGIPPEPFKIPAQALIYGRRSIFGSLVGGIKETQEMLDFCAKHNVVCEIEMVSPKGIDEAYERMTRSDVRYRFVIDNKQLETA
jgi:uncharacterized zinc-type alcohol dehydrogenase-like protein